MRALVALCASNTLGVLALYVIPIILGATADGFHARQGTSGIVSSWELGVMAGVSMLLAARYERLDLRRWSWIGALAYVAASLLSISSLLQEQWYVFLFARGGVGAGEGILFGVSSGLAARTALPERTFAWFSGTQIVGSVLCYWTMPALMQRFGPPGAFVVMAGIGSLVLPLMRWTPATSTESARGDSEPPEHFGLTAVLLLLSVGSLNLGLNTLFPYTERIGTSIGFSLAEIGEIFSLGAVLSIIGPIAAGVLGPRSGRTLPLAFGAASQIAGVFALVYATSHLLWAWSYIASGIVLMYFMPLLYGLVAYYDRTGRINAAAASVTAWASAAGPLLSGLVLNAGGGYRVVGWLTALVYAAIFAFAYQPAREAERGRLVRG